MTKTELRQLRHPSESSRFLLAVMVVVPIIGAAAVLAYMMPDVVLLTLASIVPTVWFATRLASATFLGNFVAVSPDSFPDIHAAVGEYKELFGYEGEIDVYVHESSTFDALLIPLLRRKCLLINSEVVAHAKSDNEIRWMVARFVGALASKHHRFSWLQAVIGSIEQIIVLNVLLYPYERAIVRSGDQLGLHAIGGDVASALRAMQRMMAGGPLGDRVDWAGVVRQDEAIEGSFFAWLAKCMSPFPHTASRVVNLLRYAGERHPLQLQALLAGKDEATLARVQRAIGAASRPRPADPDDWMRPAA